MSSNLSFNNLDIQSIFIGPGLINFFCFCMDCINKTVSYYNATIDIDKNTGFKEETLMNIKAGYIKFNLTNI